MTLGAAQLSIAYNLASHYKQKHYIEQEDQCSIILDDIENYTKTCYNS